MKLKHCEIVTDLDKLPVNIEETCYKYRSIKQWAYILHDKDDTRPHYHIYLNFGRTSVDTKDVANWFGLAENFVNRVKGHKSDMLKYLTHSNESQKGRHQYNITEVISNFDIQKEIDSSEIIGNFDTYSYAEQLQFIDTLHVEEQQRAFLQLETLWKLRCKLEAQKTNRNIQVFFITGESGSGKTTFAKDLLEGLGFDYCISSSNNDVFQDYQGQKGIVLDDLRDSSFALTDLLKILDNNTNSSIKSRYNNKVFNGKIIIITSCKPLDQWYNSSESNVSSESLNQLYRRISKYVKVTKGTIFMYSGVDTHGKPIEENRRTMPNVILNRFEKEEQDEVDYFEVIYNKYKNNPKYTQIFEQSEYLQSLGMTVVDDPDDGELPF